MEMIFNRAVAALLSLLALHAWAASQAGPARVVLRVSNIECAGCAKAVTASLRELDGVQTATVSEQTKRALVTFDPRQVTVQQLSEAVATTRPLRGKPYVAGLLIVVAPPARAPAAVGAARDVRGIARVDLVDARSGTVAVYFDRLKDAVETGRPAGLNHDAVLLSLRRAGLTAKLVEPEKP